MSDEKWLPDKFSDTADVIVIDGRGVLWRSSYSNASLGYATDDGFQPTGGVYGFLESVLSVAYRHDEAGVYIAWEGGKNSREQRRRVIPDYKIRRDDNPDRKKLAKLVMRQEAILKGFLKSTGWSQMQARGWEADDAIATFAAKGYAAGVNTLIVTGDADMFQCLREPDVDYPGWVRIHKPNGKKGTLWTEERLREEWNIDPEQVPDVKALAGDPSDNYNGVRGIGQKWACRIVQEHGDLLGAIEAAESEGAICGSKKKAEDLIAAKKYAMKCLKVALANEKAKLRVVPGSRMRSELRSNLRNLRFNSLNNKRAIERMLER